MKSPKPQNRIRTSNHSISKGYVWFPDEDGKPFIGFSQINVLERIYNINKKMWYIKLELIVCGQSNIWVIERKQMVRKSIIELLMNKGVSINEGMWLYLQNYLLYCEEVAPVSNIHDAIGFHVINGNLTFLLDESIGYTNNSKYQGRFNLTKHGTPQLAFKCINSYILKNIPLQFALILGLASPLLALLQKNFNLVNPLFHFWGESTTGKTTTAKVVVSSFGSISERGDGLITTYSATMNAITGILIGNNGVPIVFDESTLKARENKTNLVYQLTAGREKSRLGGDMEVREIRDWSGIFVSTGEGPLLDETDTFGGLQVRVYEFGNVQWTKSAELADNLLECLKKITGVLGYSFVQHIMSIDEASLYSRYMEIREIVYSSFPRKDEFTKRVSYIYSVIYLAALYAIELWDIKFDVDGILKFMIDNDMQQIEKRNRPIEAYEFVKQEIMSNLNKFYHQVDLSLYGTAEYGKKFEKPSNQIWGKIKSHQSRVSEVIIINDILVNLLRKGGYLNERTILHKWRADKIIKSDKGKFSTKRIIEPKTPSVRCIVIDFKNQYEKETDNNENEMKSSDLFDELDD